MAFFAEGNMHRAARVTSIIMILLGILIWGLTALVASSPHITVDGKVRVASLALIAVGTATFTSLKQNHTLFSSAAVMLNMIGAAVPIVIVLDSADLPSAALLAIPAALWFAAASLQIGALILPQRRQTVK